MYDFDVVCETFDFWLWLTHASIWLDHKLFLKTSHGESRCDFIDNCQLPGRWEDSHGNLLFFRRSFPSFYATNFREHKLHETVIIVKITQSRQTNYFDFDGQNMMHTSVPSWSLSFRCIFTTIACCLTQIHKKYTQIYCYRLYRFHFHLNNLFFDNFFALNLIRNWWTEMVARRKRRRFE